MRNMKYTEIAEKILSNMNIDDKNFVSMDANDWLYFSLLFFDHTAIFLHLENLPDDCLKQKENFFAYITSLSERRENVNIG